jgi:hypothetical protein
VKRCQHLDGLDLHDHLVFHDQIGLEPRGNPDSLRPLVWVAGGRCGARVGRVQRL